MADAWDDARDAMEKEAEVSYEKFSWTIEDILSDNWFPQLFDNH